MDILSLLKIVIRRWIVVIPVIGIVLAMGYNTVHSLKPQYQGTSDVLLFAPVQTIDPNTGQKVNGNAFADFNGNLNTVGIIIQTIVTDAAHHDALGKQNLSGSYNVTVNSSAPIMTVTAKASRPDVADATVAAVVNSISAELKTNQDLAKAPADSRVNARVLTVGPAYLLTGQRTRVAAAVGAVGIAAIIGAALLAESVASSMARRRNGRQQATDLAPLLPYQPSAPSSSYPVAPAHPAVDADATAVVPTQPPAPFPAGDAEAAAVSPEAAAQSETAEGGPAGTSGGTRWIGGARNGRALRRPASAPAHPPARNL